MILWKLLTEEGQRVVFLILSQPDDPSCCNEPTFQKHNSLLDVLGVLAPDQTPGIFEPGFLGHGSLHQLLVVFLFKFLCKHKENSR